MQSIGDVDFDIDTAQNKEDKDTAAQTKASKSWLMLRLSAKSKLAAFDKIEDGNNLKSLFETSQPPESTMQPAPNTPQDPTSKASQETESNVPSRDHGENPGTGNEAVAAEWKAADVKDTATTDVPG